MSVTVKLISSKPQALHIIYQNAWTWEQFRAATHHVLKQLPALPPGPIYAIHDLTDSTHFPSGEVVMETYKMVGALAVSNLRLIGVNVPTAYHSQIETGLRLTGQASIVWVGSMDEAMAHIEAHAAEDNARLLN